MLSRYWDAESAADLSVTAAAGAGETSHPVDMPMWRATDIGSGMDSEDRT